MGYTSDRERYRSIRGLSRISVLDCILEQYDADLSDAEKETLTDQKNEYFKGYLSDMSPDDLPPGTMQTLAELRETGNLLLAVACPSRNTRLILQQIGLGAFFDAVSDGNGMSGEISHPWVFLKAAQMLRLAPEECLAVESAEFAAQEAWDTGMTVACIGDAAECTGNYLHLHSIRELINLETES